MFSSIIEVTVYNTYIYIAWDGQFKLFRFMCL